MSSTYAGNTSTAAAPMTKGQVTYIGDGVYLEFTGVDYRLFTSNGAQETNEIFLDENVAATLVEVLTKAMEGE